jgi:hypothetical protein
LPDSTNVVRIEHVRMTCFNPTLVRFCRKAASLDCVQNGSRRFQSHLGSILPMRTNLSFSSRQKSPAFQSHLGSILPVTLVRAETIARTYSCFNPTLVRFCQAARPFVEAFGTTLYVSIPPWFDFASRGAFCTDTALAHGSFQSHLGSILPGVGVHLRDRMTFRPTCFNPTLVRFCRCAFSAWLNVCVTIAAVSIPPWFDFALGGKLHFEPSKLLEGFNPTLVRFCRSSGTGSGRSFAAHEHVSIPPWFDFAACQLFRTLHERRRLVSIPPWFDFAQKCG